MIPLRQPLSILAYGPGNSGTLFTVAGFNSLIKRPIIMGHLRAWQYILSPLSYHYPYFTFFYADPRILLVFQTLVLVSGALPVFLLTRKYLPEWPILAALMVVAYLLSPALLGLNIFDFHPISLATPLLLYAMLALDHKRYGWFILACILGAMCKEDVPLLLLYWVFF